MEYQIKITTIEKFTTTGLGSWTVVGEKACKSGSAEQDLVIKVYGNPADQEIEKTVETVVYSRVSDTLDVRGVILAVEKATMLAYGNTIIPPTESEGSA